MQADRYIHLLYQVPVPRVARIVMNRPEKRNAQGMSMTFELDAAIRRACLDDDISVIILAAAGDHFNAGHDLSDSEPLFPTTEQTLGLWGQFGAAGWEGQYSREREVYFDKCERWRNAPKPLIAEVQGSVIAGGNMLVWICDLVICADDARFKDSTPDMAIPGAEFFAHPYELGIRKAKEWLFTADWISARDAEKAGMVNHVVPRAELETFTLRMAERIAGKDRFTLKLIKESMNACQDAMGRREGMKAAFNLHQIGHMQNLLLHGFPIDTSKLSPALRERFKAALAKTEGKHLAEKK